MIFRTGLIVGAAAASLAACNEMVEMDDAPIRAGTSAAETACINAVNSNAPGSSTTVVRSEFSEVGTLVMLRSVNGTNWRCLASNSGIVEELSNV